MLQESLNKIRSGHCVFSVPSSGSGSSWQVFESRSECTEDASLGLLVHVSKGSILVCGIVAQGLRRPLCMVFKFGRI